MTDPAELVRDVQLPSGDLLIGDRWEADTSGGRREQINPSTGEPLASVAMGGPAEVDRAITAAIAAFPEWSQWAPARRRDVLDELARLIDANDLHLGVMRSLETGAPFKRRRGASLAAEYVRYNAGWVDKLEGATVPTSAGPALDYTRLEPYGVVAVLTPWNGGMVSPAMKVAPALAAGNCVVLKPAELAPLGPLRFAELCLEAGVPPGVVNVVTGGADAGAALVDDARVSKISFTGGGATARRIMEAAARNLTPVVLELGGKSANVVFADADLDCGGRNRGTGRLGADERTGLRAPDPAARRGRRVRRRPRAGGGAHRLARRRPTLRRRRPHGSCHRRGQLRADPRHHRAGDGRR